MGKKVVFPCPFNHHHQTKRDAQNYGIGSKKGKKCNCLREKVEINVFEKYISKQSGPAEYHSKEEENYI